MATGSGSGTPAASSDFTPSRDTTKYRTWIDNEFAPRQLAITDAVKDQMLENAIRYWNTHSAYRIAQMVDGINSSTVRVQLDAAFKTVVTCYPNKRADWIWNGHPYWSLVGVTVLDNFIADSILMSEAFKNYRIYVGTDFNWKFEKPTVSEDGGYLYLTNVPTTTTALLVVGTQRITATDDIKDDYINDWLLRYYKALVKQIEGHTLRAASIISVANDGQELFNEGKEEAKELQEQLFKDGRWVTFASRF